MRVMGWMWIEWAVRCYLLSLLFIRNGVYYLIYQKSVCFFLFSFWQSGHRGLNVDGIGKYNIKMGQAWYRVRFATRSITRCKAQDARNSACIVITK